MSDNAKNGTPIEFERMNQHLRVNIGTGESISVWFTGRYGGECTINVPGAVCRVDGGARFTAREGERIDVPPLSVIFVSSEHDGAPATFVHRERSAKPGSRRRGRLRAATAGSDQPP